MTKATLQTIDTAIRYLPGVYNVYVDGNPDNPFLDIQVISQADTPLVYMGQMTLYPNKPSDNYLNVLVGEPGCALDDLCDDVPTEALASITLFMSPLVMEAKRLFAIHAGKE